MDHIDGVSCIKGEIHSVMTSMRLSTRWSNVKTQKNSDLMEESQFVNSFRKLNEYLEGLFILEDVDCVLYISPFYDVVISDQASGPLTSVALSSLCKFAMFGFLSTKYPRSQEGIALVAKCISRCIFEETDWESDEVILMKLLELSTLILRCEASKLLTVELMWDIFSTCLSIHNQSRASKILRSEAETVIRHLTQSTFSKAHVCPISSDFEVQQSLENTKNENFFDGSAGITVLLCNIMKVLSSSMNLQTESTSRVKFALSILNIALEAGGQVLSSMEPLVSILSGDICRHLLRCTQSDDLEIFSLALRIIFNLFMSIKDHMKIQLEVFLTSIHLRILQSNQTSFLGQAKEELALESLLEFCREPSLMEDLYTNYDCDIQCSNLFDTIISVLCEKSQPSTAITASSTSIKPRRDKDGEMSPSRVEYKPTITIINRLSISGVQSILHSLAVKCRKSKNTLSFLKSVQTYETKTMIQSMMVPKIENNDKTASATDVCLLEKVLEETCLSTDNDNMSIEHMTEKVLAPSSHHSVKSNITNGNTNTNGNGNNLNQSSTPSPSQSPALSVSGSVVNLSIGLDDNDGNMIPSNNNNNNNPVEILRMRKLKKQRLLHTAELFNEKPLKFDWIKFALDHQLIKPVVAAVSIDTSTNNTTTNVKDKKVYPADPKSIARFLKETPSLGKTQIGEFISKGPADIYPFHAAVLQEYVDTFDFAAQDASFVKALRTFLGHFRLPGEAQCIDRLMEAFARKLYQDLGPGKPFLSADAAFVLAFSTIMLQTDLHNPNVTHKRMSQEEFIRNNRGINDGQSLPKEYLESLYEEIRSKKIEVNIEINDSFNLTDTASWDKLMKKSAAFQAPANFTPTIRSKSIAATNNNFNMVPLDNHAKDMFICMEDRLLSTILMLWQSSEDDKIISKTFQMLWDYQNICIDLSLFPLFNQVLQTCIMKTRITLEGCRKSTSNELVVNKSISNTFYQKLWGLECMYGKHELQKLLKMSIEDLLMSEANILIFHEPINWIGVTLVKAELMAKFILCISEKFWTAIDRPSWTSLTYFLIWIRSRGSLPSALATVDYQWNFDSTAPVVDFSRFQPSIYVAMCNRRARGLNFQKEAQSTKKGNSSWLGGLFWSLGNKDSGKDNYNMDDGNDYSTTDLTSFDLNISIYNDLLQSENDNINMDKLLSVALNEHPFQYCFDTHDKKTFEDIASVLLEILTSVVTQLLSTNDFVSNTTTNTNSTSTKNTTTPMELKNTETDTDMFPKCGVCELDAVFLLELIAKVSSGDFKIILNNWYRIHGMIKLILEDDLESACTNTPFFLERFTLFVIRCACEVIPHVATDNYFYTINQKYNQTSSLRQGIEGIWQTLRLLRNLPPEFIEGMSGQIGQALVFFVRPSATRIRCIVTLEEWYLTFSLMSNVIMRADARPFIWMILHHLINSNLISDTNFSPARNLLLRFLYGVFVDDNSNNGNRKNISIEWQQQSMSCLVKLTNMVLGGYINANNNQMNRIEFVTFPMPQTRGNSPRRHSNHEIISNSSITMTVPCVYFSRAKTEIELFWMETCKTFCDLSNAGEPSASQQAIFCLEVQ